MKRNLFRLGTRPLKKASLLSHFRADFLASVYHSTKRDFCVLLSTFHGNPSKYACLQSFGPKTVFIKYQIYCFHSAFCQIFKFIAYFQSLVFAESLIYEEQLSPKSFFPCPQTKCLCTPRRFGFRGITIRLKFLFDDKNLKYRDKCQTVVEKYIS